MIAPRAYALFMLAAAALCVTPGPAVLFIVARSLHQGRRAGLLSALGVACGGMAHAAFAVVGLAALLAGSPRALAAVRWAGAAYLVWIGARLLLAPPAGAAAPPAAAPRRALVTQGFVVNLLNPKTALFFLAFLPQFVDPGRGRVPIQMLLLGGSFVGFALLSDSAWALLAGTVGRRLQRGPRPGRAAQLFSGLVHVALGVATALAGRA